MNNILTGIAIGFGFKVLIDALRRYDQYTDLSPSKRDDLAGDIAGKVADVLEARKVGA